MRGIRLCRWWQCQENGVFNARREVELRMKASKPVTYSVHKLFIFSYL